MKNYLFLSLALLIAGTHMIAVARCGSCKYCPSKRTKHVEKKDCTATYSISECHDETSKSCNDGECYKPVAPEL